MITKNKTLASVEIGIETQTINVKWLNQIIEDGVVISSIPHRCAYNILQRDQFRAEVENADQYVTAAGWADTAYQEAVDAQITE